MNQIYNVNDQVLENLEITQPIKLEQEYFWTDERIKLLSKAVQQNYEVHLILDVHENNSAINITDNSFYYLGLIKPTNSLSLSLRNWGNKNVGITDKSFAYLSLAFHNLVSITLDISGWGHSQSKLTNQSIKGLFSNLPSTLVSLNLNLNNLGYRNRKITGDSLFIMGDELEKRTSLKDLTLKMSEWGNDYNKSLNVFQDEHLIFLFQSLGALQLTHLELDLACWGQYGRLGQPSILQLINLLRNNNQLIDAILNIKGCILSVDIKNQLQEIFECVARKKKLVYCIELLNQLQICTQDKSIDILNKLY